MTSGTVGSLEIGGTHVTAALVDVHHWDVVPGSRHRRPLDPQADAPELVEQIAAAAGCASAAADTSWGIAIPGPFDYQHGVGDFRGVGKFGALHGVPIGKLLQRAGVGAAGSLQFINDAHSFAVGEWMGGAGRGHERMIAATLGTGIGSAFMVAGTVVAHGPGVPQEGRLDLLRVRGRPLEDAVSRFAIRDSYASALRASRADRSDGDLESGPLPDVQEIAALAAAGDDLAANALRTPLHTLGAVLGPRVVDFRASAVVFGGSISAAWDVIGPPLRAGMDEAAPGWDDASVLVPAERLEDSALIGAAWSAWRADQTYEQGRGRSSTNSGAPGGTR